MRTGLARIEFVHVLQHGVTGEFVSEATECAADQGAFWLFHQTYMTNAEPLPPQGFRYLYRRDGAVWLAEQYGLDAEQLGRCLDENTHVRTINDATRRARAEARDPGGSIRTPAIYVESRRVGATADQVITAVREAIARSGP